MFDFAAHMDAESDSNEEINELRGGGVLLLSSFLKRLSQAFKLLGLRPSSLRCLGEQLDSLSSMQKSWDCGNQREG